MNKSKFQGFKQSLASLQKSKTSQAKSSQAFQAQVVQYTNNGGLLRTSMKFDYEINSSKMKQTANSSSSKQVYSQIKPNANIFSCMDNPKYERDFEISPKVIRKYQ